MNEHIIVRTITRLLVPFIFMYGLYVQFHGELSPGGGFQAGVICASVFILYGLVHGLSKTQKIISLYFVRICASLGVLIYAAVGIISILKGGNFLNYSHLMHNKIHGQELGIILIELGVGLTVFAVMMVIFYVFGERSK